MSNPTDSQKLRVNPVDDDSTVVGNACDPILPDTDEDPVFNKGPRRMRGLFLLLGVFLAAAAIYGIGRVAHYYGSRPAKVAKVTKSSPVIATPTTAVTLIIDSKLSLEEQNDVLLHFAEDAQSWMMTAKASNDALRAENANLRALRTTLMITASLATLVLLIITGFYIALLLKTKASAQ